MKSPVLLCSTAALLALSACATAPSSERSVILRRGKLIVTEAPPAPAAPVVTETPAPVTPVEPVVVVTPALTAPEPVTPVVVTPAPVPPPAPAPAVVVPPPTPVVPEPGMSATRSGGVVQLNWTLPAAEAGFRAVEIMRNNEERPTGRTRVRAVRATVTTLEDTVPDAKANYWYWIKLTHADGTIENLGPFAAPATS